MVPNNEYTHKKRYLFLQIIVKLQSFYALLRLKFEIKQNIEESLSVKIECLNHSKVNVKIMFKVMYDFF